MGEQRLELRSEYEVPIGKQRVVQRLHAEPVAGQKQRFPGPIPESECEHAAKSIDACLAPRLPRVDDDLGVALGAEHVPEGQQLGYELLIVVNLAVEDDNDAAVFVVERLLSGRHVDDRQPAMAQTDARLDVIATLVRAAMMLRFVHSREGFARDYPALAGIEDACYSAHIAGAPTLLQPARADLRAWRRTLDEEAVVE